MKAETEAETSKRTHRTNREIEPPQKTTKREYKKHSMQFKLNSMATFNIVEVFSLSVSSLSSYTYRHHHHLIFSKSEYMHSTDHHQFCS